MLYQLQVIKSKICDALMKVKASIHRCHIIVEWIQSICYVRETFFI